MPIKKRLNDEERLSKTVGANLRPALRHEFLHGMIKYGNYDASPKPLSAAIAAVNGWKGASWRDKCFVYVLANILYRANGKSFLSDVNYDRLKKHMWEHDQEILNSAGLHFHAPVIWDMRALQRVKPGTLPLPRPKRLKPLTKASATSKRRKLTKHIY